MPTVRRLGHRDLRLGWLLLLLSQTSCGQGRPDLVQMELVFPDGQRIDFHENEPLIMEAGNSRWELHAGDAEAGLYSILYWAENPLDELQPCEPDGVAGVCGIVLIFDEEQWTVDHDSWSGYGGRIYFEDVSYHSKAFIHGTMEGIELRPTEYYPEPSPIIEQGRFQFKFLY